MILRDAALGLGLALASITAAPAATIVAIEVPDAISVHAAQIDKTGNLVGSAFFVQQSPKGFIRHKDGTFSYAPPSALISAVSAANGNTAGNVEAGAGSEAFIGDLTGQVTPFPVKGFGFANATSVNSTGEVVGYGEKDADSSLRGFFRKAGGKAKPFDAPGAGTAKSQGTEALGLAESGISCGIVIDGSSVRHGFVRDVRGNITVFDPPGAIRTTAIAIMKDGTVGGTYRDSAGVSHAYLRAPDGTYSFYDAPGAGTGSGQGTTLLAINKKGATVGASVDSAGVAHAYLRNAAGKFAVFDAPGAGTMPNTGTFAWAVNDANQVAGDAVDNDLQDHGYMRLP
ncbi:MAG: hypothetical protein JOZ72_18225 [Alphaproteobacteria bacterium]|nr:hypothetical protein [Alphaproteobacteria bacterium]